MVKNFEDKFIRFYRIHVIRFYRIHERDGRTDRHCMMASWHRPCLLSIVQKKITARVRVNVYSVLRRPLTIPSTLLNKLSSRRKTVRCFVIEYFSKSRHKKTE